MPKRRMITLIEIMVVIFLIGLIAGVLGYNMRGSLDKGRAFKTEQAIRQIEDILEYELAETGDIAAIKKDPWDVLKKSHLVKDVGKLRKDGWGEEIKIKIAGDGKVSATSSALKKYEDNN